jgi:hypothetical protein
MKLKFTSNFNKSYSSLSSSHDQIKVARIPSTVNVSTDNFLIIQRYIFHPLKENFKSGFHRKSRYINFGKE